MGLCSSEALFSSPGPRGVMSRLTRGETWDCHMPRIRPSPSGSIPLISEDGRTGDTGSVCAEEMCIWYRVNRIIKQLSDRVANSNRICWKREDLDLVGSTVPCAMANVPRPEAVEFRRTSGPRSRVATCGGGCGLSFPPIGNSRCSFAALSLCRLAVIWDDLAPKR